MATVGEQLLLKILQYKTLWCIGNHIRAMKNNSLKIQFVKEVLNKETGEVNSYLYFVLDTDNVDLLDTYSDVKGYEPNNISGLYPYFSKNFIGNNSSVDYVNNEKYNDFYPSNEAKAFLKKGQEIRQKAGIIHKSEDAKNSFIEKEMTKLIASTGSPFSWKSVQKQEETPAETTELGNL